MPLIILTAPMITAIPIIASPIVSTAEPSPVNSVVAPVAKAATSAKAEDAKAYWMAIQFDTQIYTFYFGSLEELNNRNSILYESVNVEKLGTGKNTLF